MSIYLNDWKDEGLEGVIKDFSGTRYNQLCPRHDRSVFDGINILLASYSYQDYSGDAFVLFERDGKLFEVNGGHCSCYGLEGQWEPEEASIEALRHRLDAGSLGNECRNNIFADELRRVLDGLSAKETEQSP